MVYRPIHVCQEFSVCVPQGPGSLMLGQGDVGSVDQREGRSGPQWTPRAVSEHHPWPSETLPGAGGNARGRSLQPDNTVTVWVDGIPRVAVVGPRALEIGGLSNVDPKL